MAPNPSVTGVKGVSRVGVADTVGVATPRDVERIVGDDEFALPVVGNFDPPPIVGELPEIPDGFDPPIGAGSRFSREGRFSVSVGSA